MERKLRYSERRRLAEEGTLGDLEHGQVPEALRRAVLNLLERDGAYLSRFRKNLTNEFVEHFGRSEPWFTFVTTRDPAQFLDALEIACDQGKRVAYRQSGATPDSTFFPGLERRLNELMERHRFGYRLEGGEARKIGSPALDEVVVGPALIAIQRPGWEEVEREYRKALSHQRGGEVDDALTACNSAVEAALKAVGMTGSTLGALAKSFMASGIAPGYLANVPELLEDLLGKLMAARSAHGDAHGKAPGAIPAEQPLADLAVYWAGAFIVYLAEATAS